VHFFKKFDKKEFELGLCAILLLEKLEDGIGDREEYTALGQDLERSASTIKNIFKVVDGNM